MSSTNETKGANYDHLRIGLDWPSDPAKRGKGDTAMKTRQAMPTTTKTGRGARPRQAGPRPTKLVSAPTEEPFISETARPRGQGQVAGKQTRGKTSPQLVHIELAHPSARKVCIAGSFNDWNATEMVRLDGGKWIIDLNLP